jgi:elongation factor G
MKVYETGDIRNVVLLSHSGAGKTTLVERLLFATGITQRMGKVQDGTAAMDFEAEEIERQSSIATALAPLEYNKLKVNLMDTPGYLDFVGEVNAALAVVEGALILVEAVSGIEVGTESVWQAAEERNLPRILVVNKMDRENVRVRRVLESINNNLNINNLVPLQLPIGEGPEFKGIIDLISMEARTGENDERGPIPDDLQDAAEEARAAMVEAAAEGDDELMMKFFDEQPFTEEDIIRGLRGAISQGLCVPLIYCAPEPGLAVKPLLGALTKLLPAPNETMSGEQRMFTANAEDGSEVNLPVSNDAPLAAFIFKTRDDQYGRMSYVRIFGGALVSDSRVWDSTHDTEVRVGSLQIMTGIEHVAIERLNAGDIGAVLKLGDATVNTTLNASKTDIVKVAPIEQPNPIFQLAVHAESQSDLAKMSTSLNRLVAEDPTLEWHNEVATKQTILAGMGMTHLDIAIKKLKSKFGVSLTTSRPKIPYRETITRENSAEYTHKKQTGGAGQYARVMLRVESLDDDSEFEFASEIFGGSVSGPFVSATEKGCRAALESGVIAGYPLTGIRAVVYDGKEHPVDSKEIAFQTAGREGFKLAVRGANPVLLEPIYRATVTVPADNMGDVISDFNTRRARVQGMDQAGSKAIVRAEVPLGEMQSYQQDLRSMTQGRGVYEMEFLRYGRVPAHVQQQIVDEYERSKQEDS